MDIRARDTDRELLLEFSGEMDHHGARNALKEVEIAIDAALPRSLILDFAGVTFMDSSGIGLVLGRVRLLLNAAGPGRVVQVPAKLPWWWLSANYYLRESFAVVNDQVVRPLLA